MSSTNKYLKAGSYYLIGNLFNKGIAFLTIPVYTRILTTYDYGIINTYTSWVAIFTMILGMTFHMGIRAAFQNYEDHIDDFMSSITFLSTINAFCISIFVIICALILPFNVNYALLIMCLVQGFFSSVIQNFSMYLMMKLKYKAKTVLLVLPNLVTNIIAVIVIIFILDNNLYLGKIIPNVIVSMIIGLICVVIIFKKSNILINKNYWKYALAVSTPIILHGLSLNILSQSDRIMITSLVGASETGVYSLIYNFSMIASVVIVSLEGVWVPWFVKMMKSNSYSPINNRVGIYIKIMTFVTISIILGSPEITYIVAPKEYWHGIAIIPPIVLSSFVIFLYTLFVNIEHYYKKTKRIAYNTLIAAISNIILNLVFIPEYGAYAAAFTTLISYLISFCLHYKNARKLNNQLFPLKTIVIPTIPIIISIALFYVFMDNFVIRWSILSIYVCILLYKDKKSISSILRKDI